MRKLNNAEYKSAQLQGELFEMSLDKAAFSSPMFIRRFMMSEYALGFIDKSYLVSSTSNEELINRLRRMDDISTADALSYFRKAQYYRDPKMVHIIKQFLAEGKGQWVLINRNPTINEQGILYMKIRKIHDTFNDYTMSIPVDVLAGLGADFDRILCPVLQECGNGTVRIAGTC